MHGLSLDSVVEQFDKLLAVQEVLVDDQRVSEVGDVDGTEASEGCHFVSEVGILRIFEPVGQEDVNAAGQFLELCTSSIVQVFELSELED